ncbi:MAG: hypothetical protein H7099_08260 [Gemmatimonadaceae bacterium]|nr:hypothetical protein [Gemmatimonadaceae bacterium]
MSAPPLSIAILGNDAFLAALPALPVQLMHAALAAGFDAVVPASLGDELVAGEILRLAQLRGRRPVVQCACPYALSQLCKREANLADVTVAVAPAAVALARALRLEQPDPQHISYIGACPGAQDSSIDLQIMPDAFLRGLEQKGIVVRTQPEIFTDRLPPDRRRFLSLPGGAPRPQLVESLLRRNVVTLGGRMNPLLAVADALFDGGATMIDPAGAYHCACAGSDGERSAAEGRLAIERLEPARAGSQIFEAPPWLDLRPTMPDADTIDEGAPRETPVAFADAARIDFVVPDGDRTMAAAQPAQADAARRMYALGVRTARKRVPQAPPGADSVAQAPDPHVPPTSPSLRAQPIDREVPRAESRESFADLIADALPPPVRRTQSVDDLFRRD